MRVAALLVGAVLAGCGGAAPRSAAGVRTAALPSWAVAACDSVPELRAGCVDRAPRVRSREWQMLIRRAVARDRISYVVLNHGSRSVVAGGAPASRASQVFGLVPAVRRPVSAWLSVSTGTTVDGGRRRWGGHDGRLFLTRSGAPPWFQDLVAFTWLDGGERRLIGISAWGPFAQAVATLRAIVGERRPSHELVPSRPAGGIPMWTWLLCHRPARIACPTRLPRLDGSLTLVELDGSAVSIWWRRPR
jgi:hypothetical protein